MLSMTSKQQRMHNQSLQTELYRNEIHTFRSQDSIQYANDRENVEMSVSIKRYLQKRIICNLVYIGVLIFTIEQMLYAYSKKSSLKL